MTTKFKDRYVLAEGYPLLWEDDAIFMKAKRIVSPIKFQWPKELDDKDIPRTESLKEVIDRMIPYWNEEIKPTLKEKGEVLVAAHGNSLRAVVMYLKNMSEEEILKFNIPTGIPYVFEFDDDMNFVKDNFIGDPEEIKKLMDAVANQAKKS